MLGLVRPDRGEVRFAGEPRRRRARAAAAPADRLRRAGRRAVPALHGARERHADGAALRLDAGAHPRARRRAATLTRYPESALDRYPARAVRRPGAAREPDARADARPRGAAARRAARRARPDHALRSAGGPARDLRAAWARPSCSSRTTSARRCSSPTRSCSCAKARSCSAGRARDLIERPADPFVTRFVRAQRPALGRGRRRVSARLAMAWAARAARGLRRRRCARAAQVRVGLEEVHGVGDPGRARRAAAAGGAASRAEHRRELGGSRVLWAALLRGDIDVYPEYTGTLAAGAPRPRRARPTSRACSGRSRRTGSAPPASLGFENSYAIGMQEPRAAALGIRTLSDLARHPELRARLLQRVHGSRGRLAGAARPLPAGAARRARARSRRRLPRARRRRHRCDRPLLDRRGDRGVRPARARGRPAATSRSTRRSTSTAPALAPAAADALASLQGRIDAPRMIAMNARAKRDGHTGSGDRARCARRAVRDPRRRARVGAAGAAGAPHARAPHARRELARCAPCCVAIPLGILAARRPRLGQLLLGGRRRAADHPLARAARADDPAARHRHGCPRSRRCFLYSLLPILRNTQAGHHLHPRRAARQRRSARALELGAAALRRAADGVARRSWRGSRRAR